MPISPGKNKITVTKGNAFYFSETRPIVMDGRPGGVTIYPNLVTEQTFTINATGIPAGTYNMHLYGMKARWLPPL